jgi:hypothetical protein
MVACEGQLRLQSEYDAAHQTWMLHRLPATVAGIVLHQTPSSVGQDALQARNLAADRFYQHNRKCPLCNKLRILARNT